MKNSKKLSTIAVICVALIAVSAPMAAGEWYFKLGYPNYAPSGMPDFDQKQDAWQAINAGPDGVVDSIAMGDDIQISPPGSWVVPYAKVIAPGPNCALESAPVNDDQIVWVFCGPTAVANCFWWFDSKYADLTGWPGDGNDIFPLVQDYGVGDDHLAANVQPLVCDLANQMLTCSRGTTDVHDMEYAIDNWLNGTGLSNKLYEHTEKAPDFYWIEEEIERSQDVILLLGFWAECYPGEFHRCGGHYVTCAGVDSENMTIAVSDPFFDNAVAGGQGRIVPNPHPAGYSATFHNDTNRISHDYYNVTLSSSPGGNWALPDYPVSVNRSLVRNFQEDECWEGPIHTEIEYAVVISPRCTPAIEVNKTVWNGTAWVKEVTANVSDTLRFRLWVHNNGTCCNLTNISIMDTLSDSLNYSDNATVNGASQEPVQTGPREYVWNFAGPFAPCQNITIEFDARVIECGSDTNVVNATGWCNETMVSDEDSANVTASCAGVCGDVDGLPGVTTNDGRQIFMYLLYGPGQYPLADLWAADCDGLCDGITTNDGRQIFMNLLYGSGQYPLICC